uniref:Uncharacterized protein n=1 Tax=Arabidopsis thaliana TaxID=3702 RepID=Q0WNA0_ARATH|nr:hypothetical protein [Arabidopsis thaliana]
MCLFLLGNLLLVTTISKSYTWKCNFCLVDMIHLCLRRHDDTEPANTFLYL